MGENFGVMQVFNIHKIEYQKYHNSTLKIHTFFLRERLHCKKSTHKIYLCSKHSKHEQIYGDVVTWTPRTSRIFFSKLWTARVLHWFRIMFKYYFRALYAYCWKKLHGTILWGSNTKFRQGKFTKFMGPLDVPFLNILKNYFHSSIE